MTTSRSVALRVGLCVLLAAPLTAQMGNPLDDPRERVEQLFEQVSEELAEIDRMLLETRSIKRQAKRAADGMQRNVEAIDELIEVLMKLKGT